MSFTVTVQPSGHSFSVQPDEPILMAAIRQGVGLPYGCKDGACGSCKCKLTHGSVIHGAHRTTALNALEEDAGWILTCRAFPQSSLCIETRSVVDTKDYPLRKMPARVHRLERLAPDVMLLQLQIPTNENWQWRAGQFVDFLLPSGDRRSYSMANAPHRMMDVLGTGNPGIELHIRHVSGGLFTDHLFAVMKPRDLLRIQGPYGSFYWRQASTKPVILLAGGTGFAPIKAIIEQMRVQRSKVDVFLYWGCRTQVDLYLHSWAQSTAQEWPLLRYVPVLSGATLDDKWRGRQGWVHSAVMQDWPDLSGHQVYACGSPMMVDAARADFVEHCGLPTDEFFADAFTHTAAKSSPK